MKTRFAPSPTGSMHFGNLRTAFFNYLLAKKEQGTMILRIEDTDSERSTTEHYHELLADLQWAGIHWQEGPYKQSERAAIYEQYYQQLENSGLVYHCFCSEEELTVNRKMQLANGMPPRYKGSCKNLTKEAIQAKLAAGIKPALRFKVPQNQIIEFVDLIKGKQIFKSNDLSDFIIRRQDGSASFMLCNAIDDAVMGITNVLRGDDHLTNTPRQILLLQALKLLIPNYGHFPMITGSDGAKLSKRNGSVAIQDLRTEGYFPSAVLNYIARLGHYYEINKLMSLEELVANFQLSHINTAPARHDITHLQHWQKEAMLTLTPKELWQIIQPVVQHIVPSEHRITFTELILPNILMPNGSIEWANALFAKQLPIINEAEQNILKQAGPKFFTTAKEILQENPQATLEALLSTITTTTEARGKALFMPIRIALTGKQHGPELAKILNLIGSNQAINRFEQAIKYCVSL